MIKELKENITHGTKEYPYEQYTMYNIRSPYQIPVHWHDEFEIIYIVEGNLHVKIEEREFQGRPGDIFFVNPRELHLMDTENSASKFVTLLFLPEFIAFQTNDILETELMAPFRRNQLRLPAYVSDAKLRKKLMPILRELTASNMGNVHLTHYDNSIIKLDLSTRIMLLNLFRILYENDMFSETGSSSNLELPREILYYIQEHYTEKLSLSMLAEQFHLSEKYISRYFVEHFHLTFSSYVAHLRLTYAKQLLETTDEAVTEIALESGFPNVSYFIRSFKEAYDTSPLKYRKSL